MLRKLATSCHAIIALRVLPYSGEWSLMVGLKSRDCVVDLVQIRVRDAVT